MTTELDGGNKNLSYPIQIRWADMDMNRHLRHSAYYDFGAATRMMFLSDHGLTIKRLEELEIGPILFREEAIFKREIRLEDKLSVDISLVRATPDFARWSLRHNFIKGDGTVGAVINIDAAWMDLRKRKLTVPPESVRQIYHLIPKAEDYQPVVILKRE